MHICTLFLIITLSETLLLTNSVDLDKNLQKRLSKEARNAECCSKGLRCCVAPHEPTSFEVRALLVKCPKSNVSNNELKRKRKHVTVKREPVKSYKRQCNMTHNDYEVLNCKKKLKLTVKIGNSGITNCKNQYILIDHVLDNITGQKQKLLFPYVLKIKQQPIVQVYGLEFQSMVNAKATEKVYSKKNAGYTGCNTNPRSLNPTCGIVKYNDKVIPFSTGFCCSCENVEYVKNNNQRFASDDPIHAQQVQKNEDAMVIDIGNNGSVEVSNNKRRNSESEIDKFGHILQKRGGQDCTDSYTPPNVDLETYHDSTHCLEFSNVWYSVFDLQKPRVYHFLQIQIYEKFQDAEHNCKWRDLTKKSPIYMSTDITHYTNEQNSIAINYRSKEMGANTFALNYKDHKLLVPDLSEIDVTEHPELRGGPEEFLVVKETEVQSNGKHCDVAGVGYEAFAKQPNRCSMPKGSCLKNQPADMWKHDHEAEKAGKLGKYFLKYYGQVPEIPVAINSSVGMNKTLKLFYTHFHTSSLDVEIKADNNIILRPDSLAAITEVYIDCSSSAKTSLTVKVFNTGLLSGVFRVALTNCPTNLPASFSNIHTKPVLIPPQHIHTYNLDMEVTLPKKRFFCTIQVINPKNELIAVRNIRFEISDRCICIWHCKCTCLIADGRLKCKPLNLEEYLAAGFQGSLPVPLQVVQYTFLDDMIALMLYIFLFLCLTLLLMGLIKGLLGCCSPAIGLWGLDIIMDLPRKLNRYYESDIRCRNVVYNDEGWPVHPDTGNKVRNICLSAEFCINTVFFVLYPIIIIWICIKRMCFTSYTDISPVSVSSECRCQNGKMVQRRSSSLQNSLTKRNSSTLRRR